MALDLSTRGIVKQHEGRSVAHLDLCTVGPAFRDAVKELRWKRLGCFCAETDPCHAKSLLEFAEAFSAVSGAKRGLEEVAPERAVAPKVD